MSLLFLACLLLSAIGAGAWAMRALGREPSRDAEGLTIAATLGTALLGTAALFLGGVGLLVPAVLKVVSAAAAAGGLVELSRWWRGRALGASPPQGPLVKGERVLAALLIAACIARMAWFAWYPDLRIDAFMYHITVPRQWLLRGWACAFPYEMHASLHLLWDAWYAYGLAIARDDFILPSLWHTAAAVGVGALLHGELRRAGHPRLAAGAALGWLVAPEVLESSACAYVDNAVALYVVAGAVLLARAESRRDAALAGLMLGAAIGAKATSAAFLMATLGAWVAARLVAGRRERTAVLALVAAAAALPFALPWVVRNALTTGNPFYPFLPDLFRASPEFDLVARDFLRSYPGVFASAGDRGIGIWGLLGHANLFLVNTRLIVQNLVCVAALVAALAAFPRWRRLPFATLFLGLLAAGLVPMVVMSPARRFVLPAEALQILSVCLVVGWLLRDAHWLRQPAARVAMALGALVPFAAMWNRGNDVQLGFEHRRPDSDTRWYLTPGEMRRAHHDVHPDGAGARLLEGALGRGDCVLLTENSLLAAIANVRIHPNPHMHSPNALRVMSERERLGADAIASRLRGMGVTHVLTGDLLDSPVLIELREGHLRPVADAGEGRTLYRLAPSR